MKKYITLTLTILLFISGLMNVYAETKSNTQSANSEPTVLMRCEYNKAKIIDESNDYHLYKDRINLYVKYRVSYMSDGTIVEEMAQINQNPLDDADETEYRILSGRGSAYPTLLTEEGEVYDSFDISANYNDYNAENTEIMKNAYEKRTCPYFTFYDNLSNMRSFKLTESDETNPTQRNNAIFSTRGMTYMISDNPGGGSGELVEGDERGEAQECAVNINSGSLEDIPAITIKFLLYENGDKFVKVYFTLRGEKDSPEIIVKEGEDVVINLSDDEERDYTVTLPADQIDDFFKQTSSQEANNTFTCVKEGEAYIAVRGKRDLIITTDKQAAQEQGEGNYTDLNEGLGSVELDNEAIPDFTTGDCDSYLGQIDDPDDPAYYLNFAFNIIKYAAIVILFVFTIIDFAKAITSSKQDELQKAIRTAVKRLIIAIIIFFLPILINFILDLLGVVTTDPTCGIGQ